MMYRRISAVLFPIVALLLVGAVIWGVQMQRDRDTVLIKAENQYQRAFHDLNYHMDNLQSELGNALAVNSTSQGFHRKCLINAWRMTSEAQNEINQLPLQMDAFQKTEDFLGKLATFTYQTAVRDLNREPISPEEMETLQSLYSRSKDITSELRGLQRDVISERLRWTDVELAIASEEGDTQNRILSGFQTVDKNVGEYEEANWGPSMASAFQTSRAFDKLSGEEVTAEQVRELAVKFLDLRGGADLMIEENGADTDYKVFSVHGEMGEKGSIAMDYSKQGGHLIWFMNTRDVGSRQLSSGQAVKKATDYMEKLGYKGLRPVNYEEYANVAHITMASERDGVIFYPEKVMASVALDDGSVTGLQASDYLFREEAQIIPTEGINEDQARQRLNEKFQVEDYSLAVIKNDLNQYVPVHVFLGNINDKTYRIFLNAKDGLEEKVETIKMPDAFPEPA